MLEARTITFYNSKMVEVSTPTVKGESAIETSFYLGTQEYLHTQCPDCDEWKVIDFDDIKSDFETVKVKNKKDYIIKSAEWVCSSCGGIHTRAEMLRQPSKWIASKPESYQNGVRSFWITAFISPWVTWEYIILKFLQANDAGPEKLKVVYNTLLGRLWEDRGELEDEDTMLARREEYKAEIPANTFVLTCGVDTQDNRLEYEVVGHGHYGETWGIKAGFIMGKPDDPKTWERFDEIIDRAYLHESGKRLTISATFVDSGGHYTQEVYEACRARLLKRVFAIKGKGGDGIPYTSPPNQVPIRENKNIKCWLYSIGVDAGKASIMGALKVQESGAKYCHFPLGEERGYDLRYFNGLLSEKLVPSNSKSSNKWTWEKLPGHAHNEALDCRNYAMAAFRVLDADMDACERRMKGQPEQPRPKSVQKAQQKRNRDAFDDW